MKPSTVRLQVLRSLLLRGEHVAAGREVECTAAEAALLLESTRAVLVDPADTALIREAVQGQTAACLRAEKQGRIR
jgi:hypothetical protein